VIATNIAGVPSQKRNTSYQKGISFACWNANQYSTPSSFESLRNLRRTGAEWVAIIVTWYQQSIYDNVIRRDGMKTPSDESLVAIVRYAHSLGLKVMLKPHVDLYDDTWRGNISPADLNEWFRNYSGFVQHYAGIANQNFIEQFCIGVEYRNLSRCTQYWKGVVANVRSVYSGYITYASNFDEYRYIAFWNDVDYIGIDGFFPVSNKPNPILDEVFLGWQPYLKDIQQWYQENGRFGGKQIILTEIGYKSQEGTSMQPWNSRINSKINLAEQDVCYHAGLELLPYQEWFNGVFWWTWLADTSGGSINTDYTPYRKPAEATLSRYWTETVYEMTVNNNERGNYARE